MIEMTLSSRHRIRNSSPGGLRRARYLSVTEAPHNTNFHTWMGKKQFCFFQTAETGNRTPDSGVKGSGANHYPRAPAPRGNKVNSLPTVLEAISKHKLGQRCFNVSPTLETFEKRASLNTAFCLCLCLENHPNIKITQQDDSHYHRCTITGRLFFLAGCGFGPIFYKSTLQSQKAVSAHFTSEQILPFDFARQ